VFSWSAVIAIVLRYVLSRFCVLALFRFLTMSLFNCRVLAILVILTSGWHGQLNLANEQLLP
jgi:hypothetical protein